MKSKSKSKKMPLFNKDNIIDEQHDIKIYNQDDGRSIQEDAKLKVYIPEKIDLPIAIYRKNSNNFMGVIVTQDIILEPKQKIDLGIMKGEEAKLDDPKFKDQEHFAIEKYENSPISIYTRDHCNFLRFINHSECPNVIIQSTKDGPHYYLINDSKHKKIIKKGVELRVNYGPLYNYTKNFFYLGDYQDIRSPSERLISDLTAYQNPIMLSDSVKDFFNLSSNLVAMPKINSDNLISKNKKLFKQQILLPLVELNINDNKYKTISSVGVVTPLIYACYQGNISAVKQLLMLGSEINAYSNVRENALMVAVRANISQNSRNKIIKLLLEAKINCAQQNQDDQTALHLAIELNQIDSIQLLGKISVFYEFINKDSFDPFLYAISLGSYQIFEILLQCKPKNITGNKFLLEHYENDEDCCLLKSLNKTPNKHFDKTIEMLLTYFNENKKIQKIINQAKENRFKNEVDEKKSKSKIIYYSSKHSLFQNKNSVLDIGKRKIDHIKNSDSERKIESKTMIPTPKSSLTQGGDKILIQKKRKTDHIPVLQNKKMSLSEKKRKKQDLAKENNPLFKLFKRKEYEELTFRKQKKLLNKKDFIALGENRFSLLIEWLKNIRSNRWNYLNPLTVRRRVEAIFSIIKVDKQDISEDLQESLTHLSNDYTYTSAIISLFDYLTNQFTNTEREDVDIKYIERKLTHQFVEDNWPKGGEKIKTTSMPKFKKILEAIQLLNPDLAEILRNKMFPKSNNLAKKNAKEEPCSDQMVQIDEKLNEKNKVHKKAHISRREADQRFLEESVREARILLKTGLFKRPPELMDIDDASAYDEEEMSLDSIDSPAPGQPESSVGQTPTQVVAEPVVNNEEHVLEDGMIKRLVRN